jgi:signal transduction histidine kinase
MYKVHLMGQVLRQDLASGRLLDLETDLPDLLRATEVASEALRDIIGDLRKSTLGPGGLAQTIALLAKTLSDESGIPIHVHVDDVRGSALTHLLLYHVAREALGNSVRHSHAERIDVDVCEEDQEIRLVVQDDGSGFQPVLVDRGRHFGLQLMRERVELAGGIFFLDTNPGKGTRVLAKFPIE